MAYEIGSGRFKTLFKEKTMAGLAGYVKNGIMTKDGIDKACSCLLEFKHILESLDITEYSVFATASLRNISNTEESVSEIKKGTGFDIEVISGYDEAVFSCKGAMNDTEMENGVFIDTGGGSTEIVSLDKNEITDAISIPLGSLKLYSDFVTKILPKKSEASAMRNYIKKSIKDSGIKSVTSDDAIYCVGGTARAILKISNSVFGAEKKNRIITSSQMEKLIDLLCSDKKTAASIILKHCPDRIHTIIPGTLILNGVMQKMGCKKIVVSCFGVREGYLCQRILKKA